MMDLRDAATKVDRRLAAAFGVEDGGELETVGDPRDIVRRLLCDVFDDVEQLDVVIGTLWSSAASLHIESHSQTCLESTGAMFVALAQQLLLMHHLKEGTCPEPG